jgi:transposase-like protein/IS1 family transposase
MLYHKYMLCPTCHTEAQRFGTNRNGSQRFRCVECNKTFSGPKPIRADRLPGSTIPLAKVEKVLQLLLEGCSVRAAERISGLHRDTILKLLVTAGEKCEKLMGQLIVNVPVRDVETDEIWGFIAKKEKQITADDDPNYGDAYCFVAIERNSKVVLNFALGKRNQATTNIFIEGLRHATGRQNYQITADGFGPYISAIENTLADRVSFSQLIKVYRATPEGERKYSPAEVVSTEVVPVLGNPDPRRVCTSVVERQNLTMRTQMRRLTRLTNGFSNKWENHWAALCLHFAHYNFCRIHRTLRVTPAMQAGITDRVWDIADLLA